MITKKSGVLTSLTLFIAVLGFNAQAQRWELGMGTGACLYKGELAPNYNASFAMPGGQIFTRLNFNHFLAAKASLGYYQIRANGLNTSRPFTRTLNNESFETGIIEAAVMGEYNFLDYRDLKKNVRNPNRFSPYLTGGVCLFNYGTIQPEGNSIPVLNLGIPIGFGVKWAFSHNWNLGAEFVSRKTFTGYLDGHKKSIAERQFNEITGQFETKPRPQRGFNAFNDWYTFIGINLSYTIWTVPCPDTEESFTPVPPK